MSSARALPTRDITTRDIGKSADEYATYAISLVLSHLRPASFEGFKASASEVELGSLLT